MERLTNSLMMHGRNNGKKLMAVRIVKHSFEIIHLLTGEVTTFMNMHAHEQICRHSLYMHRFSLYIHTHCVHLLPMCPRIHYKCWWMPLPTVVRGRTPRVSGVPEPSAGRPWTSLRSDESTRPSGSSAQVRLDDLWCGRVYILFSVSFYVRCS